MKILVIRFSSIGDIVLTTPVLRALKKKYPDAELHYLTKAQFYPVLAANPYIDKFYLLEKDLGEILEDLRKEKYDLLVDLHKNLRTLRVKEALGVPQTITFNKLNIEKWLKVNLKIDLLPEKHIVDRYYEALAPLGIENDEQGLDYYIWDKEISDYLANLVTTPYTAFAVGAQHATKQLSVEQIARICELVNGKIYILGGKKEEAIGQKLNEMFPAKIVNLCGKLGINASAYVVKHARKVITHDTGLMHIAAAFKKPIISIWGSTVPSFGMYPYYGGRFEHQMQKQSYIFEVQDLPCRPCSKIGYEKCPRGHFKCMNSQDPVRIAQAVNS